MSMSHSPIHHPDDLYASPPPWDIGRPQPTFLALADAGELRGHVLDVGCGTGEHALLAAGLGLDATGVDLAATALRIAEDKARERGRVARFAQLDARNLGELGDVFDTVLDCGLFHLFTGEDQVAYLAGLRAVLHPGGRYFMLGISDREPGDWGRVHKLTRDDVVTAFVEGWRLDSLSRSRIDITPEPGGVHAWFAAATKV
ncbi:class I SAM-dependent methyltransferase [Amycolatopsis sp. NPDC005003]